MLNSTTKLLGVSLVCFASACSVAPQADDGLPLTTSDPSAHPEYYDTQIVSIDSHGEKTILWQHTTPEQYAREVAAHTKHANSGPATAVGSTVGEVTGASSSPIVSRDTGCAGSSVWIYNYDRKNGFACDAPTYYGESRICFHNDNYNIEDQESLQAYPVYGGTWKGNVAMFWPGDQNGSFGRLQFVIVGGSPTYTYIPAQSFTAYGNCTTGTAGSLAEEVSLK